MLCRCNDGDRWTTPPGKPTSGFDPSRCSESKGHINSSFFALDDHGTNFAWGVGSQAHYGPWGIRLEYEQFNVPNTNGVQAVTFDVSFRFL